MAETLPSRPNLPARLQVTDLQRLAVSGVAPANILRAGGRVAATLSFDALRQFLDAGVVSSYKEEGDGGVRARGDGWGNGGYLDRLRKEGGHAVR